MKKRTLVASAVAAATIAGTGAAWSLWSVRGSALSTAVASDARLEVTASPAYELYPGGYREVTLTVQNPNSYPVSFGRFSVFGVNVDPDHQACPPSVVVLDPATANPNGFLSPLSMQDFVVGVGLEATAPEACKGARFDIEYVAEGSVGA